MRKCFIPLCKSVLPSRMDAEGELEKCCSHCFHSFSRVPLKLKS